ncbi:hypothetical protein ACS0TY_035579 [Phlomoides rotata]
MGTKNRLTAVRPPPSPQDPTPTPVPRTVRERAATGPHPVSSKEELKILVAAFRELIFFIWVYRVELEFNKILCQSSTKSLCWTEF